MPEINKKEFLAKESINSTAAIHTKLRPDGIAQIRISDCNNSIKLWNNLNHTDEHAEMMEKINTIITHLEQFKTELIRELSM